MFVCFLSYALHMYNLLDNSILTAFIKVIKGYEICCRGLLQGACINTLILFIPTYLVPYLDASLCKLGALPSLARPGVHIC